MSVWMGSVTCTPDGQEVPGMPAAVSRAPADHTATVDPTDRQGDVDNDILVEPNYSGYKEES